MISKRVVISPRSRFHSFPTALLALAVSLVLLPGITPAFSQAQPQTPPQDNTQNNGKPKQEAPAEAGGPSDNVGPYAIPKKKADAPPPPPPTATAPKVEGMSDYSIRVNVPLVNVDVLVTTKNGQFVPGLKKDNFRIFEDGSPQQITNFNVAQAPLTAVMLAVF